MTSDQEEKDIAVIKEGLKHVENRKIKDECREEFVSKERFIRVERVVYGAVGLVLTGFIVYIMSLVFKAVPHAG